MENISRFLVMAAKRVFIFYVIVFLLVIFTLKHEQALTKAEFQTLNRLMPYFDEFVDHVIKGDTVDQVDWSRYIHYFEKVTEYVPFLADARFLLGYCYYQIGKEQKALSVLQESIELNSAFFWSHYNMGIIYFKNNQFARAAEAFEKALKTKPEVAIKVITISQVYRPLIKKLEDPAVVLVEDLKAGYQDCLRLVLLSKRYQQEVYVHEERVTIEALQGSLSLRIF